MKILIINPNSNPEFTNLIRQCAKSAASENTEVECLNAPLSPAFIETHQDEVMCAPGMMELMRTHEKNYDGFIVACTCDVNVDVLREMTDKPVIGAGEASMLFALTLGGSFSVIQTTEGSVQNKRELVRKFGFNSRCASVRYIDEKADGEMEDKLFAAAQKAVNDDGAEVITLGCAGLAGLEKRLSKRLGVPVVDGVAAAVKMTEGLIACGLKNSRRGKYKGE